MNPIGFGLGGHGNGHNGHDDNSPNSSRGNPSSSRGSGTLPTEVSPEYARAGRQPGNPALFNVETYQPSLFAQGYMMNSGIPPYALKPTNVAGLQVFEVDHYYTTSRVAVETRYLRINAPGVADFTSIIKAVSIQCANLQLSVADSLNRSLHSMMLFHSLPARSSRNIQSSSGSMTCEPLRTRLSSSKACTTMPTSCRHTITRLSSMMSLISASVSKVRLPFGSRLSAQLPPRIFRQTVRCAAASLMNWYHTG